MSENAELRPDAAGDAAAALAERVVANLGSAVHASQETLRLPFLCLLAEGHVLVEDVPGVGKTVLAKALARSLELGFHRVQFTPDLLPADVTGVNVFDRRSGVFRFRPGPLFANVVLVDEINRASPKTQSALLEAMQETQVTVDGATHALERPFLVIATQNPIEYEGTYPLPEAQLDRFLFNVLLDYLSAEDEVDVVNRNTTRMELPDIKPCTTPEQILQFQWLVRQVPVSMAVSRYAVDLVRATRPHDPNAPEMVKKYVQYGASVRATQFITLAAKARALMQGRYHVTHEDVASLALPVMRHRVLTNYFAESDGVDTDKILTDLVKHLGADNRQARVG